MRTPRIAAWCCTLVAALAAGCGGDERPGEAAVQSSGKAYRTLSDADREAVAARCRDRAAGAAAGAAAEQLRAIDPMALRLQLDDAFRVIPQQGRRVAEVCSEAIPFVTPGLTVRFDGAHDDGDGTFSVQTASDKRLVLSGRVEPAPAAGRVTARREVGPPVQRSAQIGPGGRFVLPPMRLRKLADNTFTITVVAPPNATRKISFSAICLDCLAGGAPPPT